MPEDGGQESKKDAKKEIKPTRIPVEEQKPDERVSNFSEVNLGYDAADAMAEASRCLLCKKPLCISGCPVEIDIPAFVNLINEGEFGAAIRKIKEKNSLPAVCGRVCPQESQCEEVCVLGNKYEPVAIGRLERFVADWGLEKGGTNAPDKPSPSGKKAAIIGSGPAGLTAAGELIRMGHQVAIFEALHEAGGVLVYGIPEFRLPKNIVTAEVDSLRELGVDLRTDMVVGKILTIDDILNDGFDSVFIGTGAGFPVFLGSPGENLNGVYSANEYLTRVNLMKAYKFPEYDTPIKIGNRVAVIGGGNTAMDAARTAMRLGAEEVYLVYRRSEAEIPARLEELHHAKEEGLILKTLTNPEEFLGENGFVTGMRCLRMELAEPDASGRPRPVPIADSDFEIEIDTAIIAVGTSSNPIIPTTTPGLNLNKWGYIEADESGQTSRQGVFAGGDIVTGSATVILAAGMGQKAARAIDTYMRAQ